MNVRLLVSLASPVVAGFVLGLATASRGEGEVVATEGKKSARGAVSALSGGSVSSAALLSRVAAHPGAGDFSKLMAYMRLLREAKVEEFPGLLERIGRDADGGEMGHADILTYLLVERWAAEDPFGAFEAVVAGEPTAMRDEMWAMLPAVAKQFPKEAWALVRAMEHRGRRYDLERNLMEQIAQQRPRVALELLEGLSPSSDDALLKRTLPYLAKTLPLEAMACAERLPVGALGARSMAMAINGEFVMSRILASSENESVAMVARSWAHSDPEAAVAWAEAQEGSRRASVLVATVKEWGKSEPEAALRYAQENFRVDEILETFNIALAQSSLPVEQRREVAESFGAEPMQSMGYYRLTQDWIREDAEGLGAWLAERPGQASSVLMAKAAGHWAAHDKEEAAAGAVRIADPELRRIAIEAVAERLRVNRSKVSADVIAPDVKAAMDALDAAESGGSAP